MSHGVAMSSPLSPSGPFGQTADELLTLELPDLPHARRAESVAFVCRRADQLPAPLRAGLVVLTVIVGVARRLCGCERTTGFLAATSLPFVGELARMVRSLAFAYIWETWPETTATGDTG